MAAMGVEELEASGARCRRPTFTAPRPCMCVLSHGPKIHQSASNLTARICAMSMADASNLSIGSTYIHNGCCLVRWYRLLSGLLLPITFQVVMLESVMYRCQSRHELVHRWLLVRGRCCRRWLVDEEADFWDCLCHRFMFRLDYAQIGTYPQVLLARSRGLLFIKCGIDLYTYSVQTRTPEYL
jgi:hypothetical protein